MSAKTLEVPVLARTCGRSIAATVGDSGRAGQSIVGPSACCFRDVVCVVAWPKASHRLPSANPALFLPAKISPGFRSPNVRGLPHLSFRCPRSRGGPRVRVVGLIDRLNGDGAGLTLEGGGFQELPCYYGCGGGFEFMVEITLVAMCGRGMSPDPLYVLPYLP